MEQTAFQQVPAGCHQAMQVTDACSGAYVLSAAMARSGVAKNFVSSRAMRLMS